jgi:hypothetical protein
VRLGLAQRPWRGFASTPVANNGMSASQTNPRRDDVEEDEQADDRGSGNRSRGAPAGSAS